MMRIVRWWRRIFVLVLGGVLLTGAGVHARAQSPSAPPTPRIDGEVSGGVAVGETLDVRADVTMAGGWQALHLVEVGLVSNGREIEHMTYDIESTRIEIGGHDVLIGTGDQGVGTYLGVRGPRVIVTTGGPYLSIQIHADVLRTLPQQVRFRLSATDDAGATAQITRARASAKPEDGFGWDVVIAAVLGALLVGASAGNLVASRRKQPPKLSVYGAVQRRLDAEASKVSPEP